VHRSYGGNHLRVEDGAANGHAGLDVGIIVVFNGDDNVFFAGGEVVPEVAGHVAILDNHGNAVRVTGGSFFVVARGKSKQRNGQDPEKFFHIRLSNY
jgi:uncharacterized cupin superfamily protein